jgi:biopolymer transport protein TolR
VPTVHHNGGGSGGRRGRGARVNTTLSEINVVPLIDVMLVLLIIFMVTAPMMQQGLQVNLPQARRADPVNAQPITVTVPADFRQTRMVQLNSDNVRLDVLQERLRQVILGRDDKSVYVRGDGTATLQDLFDVTDKLKEAGVDKVAVMSKPREGR